MKTKPDDTVDTLVFDNGDCLEKGLTKREYFALHFACAMIRDISGMSPYAAHQGVLKADELIKKLNTKNLKDF